MLAKPLAKGPLGEWAIISTVAMMAKEKQQNQLKISLRCSLLNKNMEAQVASIPQNRKVIIDDNDLLGLSL
jgi:hypothetical protein